MSRQSACIARGCLPSILLVFVIFPVAGFAFAVWLIFTPTSSEAAAATAYQNAPACSSSLPAEGGCIHGEQAEIVSFRSIVGRCGSHTDQFMLRLIDGLHQAELAFGCLAANRSYALADGRVAVREYRRLVTTVYDVEGRAYETTDSPSGGASDRRGVAALMLVFLGAWLGVLVAVAIGFMVTKRPKASSPYTSP